MKIYVDADACPKVIKEILYRAANRTKTSVILVANQFLQVPTSPYIKTQHVQKGFDVADSEIVKQIEAGDLVITADIPLADEVIQKGGVALSPRGLLFTKDNIKQRLATRDLMADLRDAGIAKSGPKALDAKDKQAFANQLDRLIAKSR